MHEVDDEFAIPIVRLWEHLLVPVMGEISDQQAAELSGDVLEAVHRTGATNLLIDVSGVAVMDSHLCATFARLAASARMMGVSSIISGLTPEIVMTLQTMGVELEDIRTTLSLEEALMMLGIGKLQPTRPPSPPTHLQSPPTSPPPPSTSPEWPGPVDGSPYGAAPHAGPGAAAPAPAPPGPWVPHRRPPPPPYGGAPPPPSYPGGQHSATPAFQPLTQGRYPDPRTGDPDE